MQLCQKTVGVNHSEMELLLQSRRMGNLCGLVHARLPSPHTSHMTVGFDFPVDFSCTSYIVSTVLTEIREVETKETAMHLRVSSLFWVPPLLHQVIHKPRLPGCYCRFVSCCLGYAPVFLTRVIFDSNTLGAAEGGTENILASTCFTCFIHPRDYVYRFSYRQWAPTQSFNPHRMVPHPCMMVFYTEHLFWSV